MAKTKTGLGRGIGVLIPGIDGDESISAKGGLPAKTLKLSQIEPNKDQPRKRFAKESLDELARSIKEYGVIQPIIVSKKDGYYEIIAGERRWRAAKKAGLKEIPVFVKEYTDREVAEISLIENIQREDLNPIEEALAYRQLIEEYSLTQEELAERISKSRAQISNTMRLLALHDKVQKMLADGKISQGHARALLALEDKNTQLEAAEEVAREGLSVRQTEDLVRKMLRSANPGKTAPRISRPYTELERKLTDALGTKVAIRQSAVGKGKVEISYFSEEQLDQIYKAINKGAR